MKKRTLYLILTALFSISIALFLAFKSETNSGVEFAVVEYHQNAQTVFANEDGRTDEIKYSIKSSAEGMIQVIKEMDA